jgi:hypothetical protein
LKDVGDAMIEDLSGGEERAIYGPRLFLQGTQTAGLDSGVRINPALVQRAWRSKIFLEQIETMEGQEEGVEGG